MIRGRTGEIPVAERGRAGGQGGARLEAAVPPQGLDVGVGDLNVARQQSRTSRT